MTIDSQPVTTYSDWRCGRYQFTQRGDLPVLEIEHPLANCTISMFGAQVLSFCPAGGRELLWMSEGARFDGSTAIRGGIPICWPWFGNHHDGQNGKKSHGFARNSIWQLEKLRSDDSAAYIELGLSDSKYTYSQFPYRFSLKLQAVISQSLEVKLVIENQDRQPFEFTAALHGYFAVSDITQTRIVGLPNACLNSVDIGEEIVVEAPFTLGHALDYVFENQYPLELCSSFISRIESSHADSIVVWNPWFEGAREIQDMCERQYTKMVCIEPAILQKPVMLMPQQRFCLDLTVATGPQDDKMLP